jgi:hypothetical protein
VFVFKRLWLADTSCTSFDSFVVNASCVIYREGNIFDAVAVPREMSINLSVRVKSTLEYIENVAVSHNVDTCVSVASFKALNHAKTKLVRGDSFLTYGVGDIFEAHFGGVKGSSLLGIANPEAYMVKAVKNADGGLKLNRMVRSMSVLLFQ